MVQERESELTIVASVPDDFYSDGQVTTSIRQSAANAKDIILESNINGKGTEQNKIDYTGGNSKIRTTLTIDGTYQQIPIHFHSRDEDLLLNGDTSDVTYTPREDEIGQAFDINFTVTNNGTERLREFTIDIYTEYNGPEYINTSLTITVYQQAKPAPTTTTTTREPSTGLLGYYLYVVENPFNIDILTEYINESTVDNPMRYMCLSSNEYVGVKASSVEECTPVSVSDRIVYESGCPIDSYADGVFIGEAMLDVCGCKAQIYVFYQSGQYHYLMKQDPTKALKYIRPNNEYIDKQFNQFDEFEKVLLYRSSNPPYTAYFDTPFETDYGYRYTRESYTWPSNGDPETNYYLPQINTPAFTTYVGKLIDLATFYDGYWSDNIWRSMTHEAIKNLDWTFIRTDGDSVEDMSDIDSSKVEMITRLWGRNSDDVKSYIDNIKNTSKVSYDQKNNTPDYFLSDEVEISGIGPITLGLTSNNLDRTDNLSYCGLTTGFTASEANSEIFRRIRLNKRYLNSVKGTREGVIAMLELLGLHSGETNEDVVDYEINEYVTVARNFPDGDMVISANKSRDSLIEKSANDEPVGELDGLPVVLVEISSGDSGNTSLYVIPWCDVNNQYDNGLYFQMYGGWGHRLEKEVFFNGQKKKINSVGTSFGIYDETVQRLKYAYDETELVQIPIGGLIENDICYVLNVEREEIDITESCVSAESEVEQFNCDINILMHYYVWKPTSNGSYTWVNIADLSPEAGIIDRRRAIYLSTIIETTLGNNQHTGPLYDNGMEYIERLDGIFKYLCDDFTENYPGTWNFASGLTFEIDRNLSIDNDKCWFFTDDQLYYENSSMTKMVNSCGDNIDDTYLKVPFNTGLTLHSAENEDDFLEETNSYSLVNLKNMEIKFYYPKNDSSEITSADTFWVEYKRYIDDVVMYYVKQMIPSTTILKYSFNSTCETEGDNCNQPDSDTWKAVDNEIIVTVN